MAHRKLDFHGDFQGVSSRDVDGHFGFKAP
jgi:hypothetical protein